MAWYDASWTYRKPITVTETSGNNVTDYQVKFTVTFVAAKMNSDFSDLRFTSDDGTTLIDYWIESKTDDTSAVVWIEVPSISASSTATVYMYYGNSGASTASSMANTFIFSDDFPGDAIDGTKWDVSTLEGGSVTVASSEATFTGASGGWGAIKSDVARGTKLAIRARVKMTASAGQVNVVGWSSGDGGDPNPFGAPTDGTYVGSSGTNKILRNWSATNNTSQAIVYTNNTYMLLDVIRDAGQSRGNVDNGASTATNNSNYATGDYPIVIAAEDSSASNIVVDWIVLRKAEASDPTSEFGSEETNSSSGSVTQNAIFFSGVF